MDTWTIVVGIFTIIGVVVTTALFMMSNIDKKIEEKINNPKFIKKLAEEVKLPFVIFDENNKILADYGAYQYLDRIDTQKKDGELIAIRITPKQFMNTAPIIENMNGYLDFFEAERADQIDWLFKIDLRTGDIIVTESYKEPINKFKLTIIK